MNPITLPLAIVLSSASLLAQSPEVTAPKPAQVGELKIAGETITVGGIGSNLQVEELRPGIQIIQGGGDSRIVVQQPKTAGQTQARGDYTITAIRPGEVGVWLGLSLKARTDGPERLEVVEVIPGSPAERAGVLAGDKLVALGGRVVTTHPALLELLRARHPGERTLLTVERSQKIQLGTSTTAERQAFLGVSAANSAATDKSVVPGTDGFTISEIIPGSAAESSGLKAGDRICAVDGKELKSSADLPQMIQAHQPGESVELRTQKDMSVELAQRPVDAVGGRKITGMGGNAFGERNGNAPMQPVPGNGRGLFRPDPGQSGLWTTEPPPQPPQQESPQESTPMPREQPAPGAQGGLGHAKKRSATPSVPPAPNGGISAQLLEEIRSLRSEVAALRHEIDALREKQR